MQKPNSSGINFAIVKLEFQ